MMKKGAIAILNIILPEASQQDEKINKIIKNIQTAAFNTDHDSILSAKFPGAPKPNITILARTIALTLDSEKPQSLLLLSGVTCRIISKLLKENTLVRGAIGYGRYLHSNSCLFGPKINEVAQWSESCDWVGVTTTPKTSALLDEYAGFNFSVNNHAVMAYEKYAVPTLNNSCLKLNCLNWPGFLQAEQAGDAPRSDRDMSKHLFDIFYAKQKTRDAAALRLCGNTVKFIKQGLKHVTPDPSRKTSGIGAQLPNFFEIPDQAGLDETAFSISSTKASDTGARATSLPRNTTR